MGPSRQTLFQAPGASWNDASWQTSVSDGGGSGAADDFPLSRGPTLSILRQASECDSSAPSARQRCDLNSQAGKIKASVTAPTPAPPQSSAVVNHCNYSMIQAMEAPANAEVPDTIVTVCVRSRRPCITWLQASLSGTLAVP